MSSWKPPPDDLSNYDVIPSTNLPGFDLGRTKDGGNASKNAFVCNQDDNCKVFVMSTRDGSAWFKTTADQSKRVGDGSWNLYVKKNTNWPKAKDSDKTNIDGVLKDSERKTEFKTCNQDYYGSCYPPTKNVKVGSSCGGDNLFVNDTVGIQVPLGFRYFINDSGGGVYASEGSISSYDGNENGYDWRTPGYKLFPNRIRNKTDCIILQNVGFDVEQYWDKMTENGIHPEDQLKIKHNFCKKKLNIDKPVCTNFYNSADAKNAGFSYTIDKFRTCADDPNWKSQPNCIKVINDSVKNQSEAPTRQAAKQLVQEFCDANPTDTLCSCHNAKKYGKKCMNDENSSLPGCDTIKRTLGNLPDSAQVPFSDMDCILDDCTSGISSLLPDFTPNKQCPPIQQCIKDFRNANFEQSQLDASCKLTLNLNGNGTGGGAPATSGTSGGTGGSGGAPATGGTSEDDNRKYYIAGGVSISIVLLCSFILLFLGIITLA